jgi:ATP-dependent Clp protease ATP-binding subunit ClpB
VRDRLRQKKIHLHYTSEAIVLLGALGFDPNFGARPVKRVIQQMVENEVAVGVLRGDFSEDDSVLLDVAPHHERLEIRKIDSSADANNQMVAND